MKVLYITNMYPCKEKPLYGIFVRDQINNITANHNLNSKVIFIKGFKGKINYILSIIKINLHLLFNKYDIIHIHFGLSGLFLLFNPFIKAKKILTIHGSDILDIQHKKTTVSITKKVANKVDLVIAVTTQIADYLVANKINYFVQPCGIDTNVFVPNNNSVNININKYLIVFPSTKIGRPEKNYTLFSKVIKVLTFEYKYEVEEICLENMNHYQVAEVLNKANCMLMTSLTEGSPQTIKEAIACNTPIVSTKVGNVKQMLEGISNCFVSDSFDEYEIASLVKIVLENNKRSDGRNKIYEQKIDIDTVSKNIYNQYLNLLKNE